MRRERIGDMNPRPGHSQEFGIAATTTVRMEWGLWETQHCDGNCCSNGSGGGGPQNCAKQERNIISRAAVCWFRGRTNNIYDRRLPRRAAAPRGRSARAPPPMAD